MKILQILVLIAYLGFFANAQIVDKAVLSGNIYDANGSLIVGAEVTAINEKGEKFQTITNDEGIYILKLPYNPYENGNADFKIAKYEIIVDAHGFERKVIKDFDFVHSSKGKMQFDIALNVKTYIDPIIVNTEGKKEINKRKNNK